MRGVVLLVFLFAVLARAQFIQADPEKGVFVDPLGRSRIFHGVNAVYKIPPWMPSTGPFDPQLSLNAQDIANLQSWGFTSVRLGTMWPGVEPQKGQYNMSYLAALGDIVNALGQAGIYSIIDMHQDIISRYYCGEGLPDWAVDRSAPTFPFPSPVNAPDIRFDNVTGYPLLEDCLKLVFSDYYPSDAVSVTFQRLYTNADGLADALVGFWQTVAQYFQSNPYVLGYELINEPWAGDYLSDLSLLLPGVTDKTLLAPLYSKLHSAIRTIDSSHIIFFEPMVFDIGLSGFSEGPGGPAFNNRQAYSYHIYCGVNIDSLHNSSTLIACDGIDELLGSARMSDLQRMNVTGFMTEFGALNGTHTDVDSLEFLTSFADEHLQSWNYWQFKFYNDLTTQGPGESFYNESGDLNVAKLKALSRTYAPAIAGQPSLVSFDTSSAAFSLLYFVDLNVTAPTMLFLNEDLWYPNGYGVSISPDGAASWSSLSKNWIEIKHLTTQNGLMLNVEISAQ